MKLTDPRTRAYLYRVALAAIPLLVVAGRLTSGDATLIVNVLAAVLATGSAGLAVANTSTAAPVPPPVVHAETYRVAAPAKKTAAKKAPAKKAAPKKEAPK